MSPRIWDNIENRENSAFKSQDQNNLPRNRVFLLKRVRKVFLRGNCLRLVLQRIQRYNKYRKVKKIY